MNTEVLNIGGMTCGGCASSVTRALKAVSGVTDVEVSFSAGTATVMYDECPASPEQLNSAVTDAGYSVDGTDTAQTPRGKGCCCG